MCKDKHRDLAIETHKIAVSIQKHVEDNFPECSIRQAIGAFGSLIHGCLEEVENPEKTIILIGLIKILMTNIKPEDKDNG